MTKSRTLVLALTLSLGLSAPLAGPRSPTSSTGPAAVAVADVQGSGPWAAILGCGACVGGGIALAASGWGAVWGALFLKGSSIGLGVCIATCAEAF